MSEIYIGTPKLSKLYAGVPKASKIYIGTGTIWQGTIPVNKPTELNPNFYYDGVRKTNLYNCPTGVTMVGTDRAKDGGVYTATYTPQDGYAWADDGTQTPITVTMTIYYKWSKWNVNYTYSYSLVNCDNSLVTDYGFTTGLGIKEDVFGDYYGYYLPDVDCEAVIERSPYSFDPTTGTIVTYDNQIDNLTDSNGWTYKTYGSSLAEVKSRMKNFLITGQLYCSRSVYTSTGVTPGTIAYQGENIPVVWDGPSLRWKSVHREISSIGKGTTSYGYVYSTTISDYPQGGVQDGYWYEKTW